MKLAEKFFKFQKDLFRLQHGATNTAGENPYAIDNFPGYCLNCKLNVLAHNATRIIMLNQREARLGNCPECKTKIYQIETKTVTPDEYQEYRISEIREVAKQMRSAYNELVKQKEWLEDPLTQATLKWANFFEE